VRAARQHLYETLEEFLPDEQRRQLQPLINAEGKY
jgi:hypothetical protein